MRRFLIVLALLALAILVWPSTVSAGVCAHPRLLGHSTIAGAVAKRLHDRPVVRAVVQVATAPVRFFRRCR